MLFSLRNLSRTYASVIHYTIILAVNETCKEVTKIVVGTHFPADKSHTPISQRESFLLKSLVQALVFFRYFKKFPRLRSHCDDLSCSICFSRSYVI